MPTHHKLINGDSRYMSKIADGSVQLVVTSPPYWQLKDYGNDNQIGFNDTYEQYINNLNAVWAECYRILQDGCRLCINIGDQFARSTYYGRYKVVPIHSEIIRCCEALGFDFMGSIVWQKPTSIHTSGGAKVMGSYPYPRGGIVKIDFEHILLFKKQGKTPSANKEAREASKLTDEEWNTYFSSHWHFNGEHQNRHIAVFPKELPLRLIKMFSFVGDTVCDPFMGSGTTALAARDLERNSIGYEINQDFRLFYQEKVIATNTPPDNNFEFSIDTSTFSIDAISERLPYKFVDVHKLDKQIDIKQNTYGSKIAMSEDTQKYLRENAIPDTIEEKTSTVLVNHMREKDRELAMQLGITYTRAGDSKGSLLVKEGFERLGYICLHTNGDNPQLFKQTNKGFRIYTAKDLQNMGFSAENAPYYAVFLFDPLKPIRFDQEIDLHKQKYTQVAHIEPLRYFITLK